MYQRELPARESADSSRLWFPVRDGIDRLGVLLLAYPSWDDDLIAECEALAALVAGLLISKGQFTDDFVRAYRLRPLTLGAELCRSLLPPLSFSTRDISVAGALEPAYEVAGDSFDYALNGSSLHVAIFDGMGHDLQAARLTELMVSGYRHCRRTLMTLRDTYEYLDHLLRDVFGDDRFVTALLAVLNADDGTLRTAERRPPGDRSLVHDRRVVDLPASHRHDAPRTGRPRHGRRGIPTRTVSTPARRIARYCTSTPTASRRPEHPTDRSSAKTGWVDVIDRDPDETHVLAEAMRRLMHANRVRFTSGHWRDDATIVMVHWTP